jgi:hypothetical protein
MITTVVTWYSRNGFASDAAMLSKENTFPDKSIQMDL